VRVSVYTLGVNLRGLVVGVGPFGGVRSIRAIAGSVGERSLGGLGGLGSLGGLKGGLCGLCGFGLFDAFSIKISFMFAKDISEEGVLFSD